MQSQCTVKFHLMKQTWEKMVKLGILTISCMKIDKTLVRCKTKWLRLNWTVILQFASVSWLCHWLSSAARFQFLFTLNPSNCLLIPVSLYFESIKLSAYSSFSLLWIHQTVCLFQFLFTLNPSNCSSQFLFESIKLSAYSSFSLLWIHNIICLF